MVFKKGGEEEEEEEVIEEVELMADLGGKGGDVFFVNGTV